MITAHHGDRSDHGLRRFCASARPQLHDRPRRYLHHHGRQRLRQEHAAAAHDRPAAAGQGRCVLRATGLLARRAPRSASGSCAHRRAVSERRVVELDDAGRKHRLAAGRVHRFSRRRNPRDRLLKLALVGLAGFEDYYPSEISGGMQKRAGLARAMALDPEILFFDEPSAGLDPISSRLLDDLILELRDSLGAPWSSSPTSWRASSPSATTRFSSIPRPRPCWRPVRQKNCWLNPRIPKSSNF